MNGAWPYGTTLSGVFCDDTWPPNYAYDVGCFRSGYHNQNDREVGVTNITTVGAGWPTSGVTRNGLFENDDDFADRPSPNVGTFSDYHHCSDNFIWNGFGGDWGWPRSGPFSTNDFHTHYTRVDIGCRDL